jgi:hypothetical protein
MHGHASEPSHNQEAVMHIFFVTITVCDYLLEVLTIARSFSVHSADSRGQFATIFIVNHKPG